MELVRLAGQTEGQMTKEVEEQVRKDLEALGKVLPMVQESVEMMEEVRDELSEKLKVKSEELAIDKEEKERMLRDIEREIKLRV